jgi:plasmid stabilization system protein ParE
VRFRYTPQALHDLEATCLHIREHNPSAAVKVLEQTEAMLAKLARAEVEGPEVELRSGERVRTWPIHPFRVYYVRDGSGIVVLRLHHHARRPLIR